MPAAHGDRQTGPDESAKEAGQSTGPCELVGSMGSNVMAKVRTSVERTARAMSQARQVLQGLSAQKEAEAESAR